MVRIATTEYTDLANVWDSWVGGQSVADFLAEGADAGAPVAEQVRVYVAYLADSAWLADAVWAARYGHQREGGRSADPTDYDADDESAETEGMTDDEIRAWIMADLRDALTAYAEANA